MGGPHMAVKEDAHPGDPRQWLTAVRAQGAGSAQLYWGTEREPGRARSHGQGDRQVGTWQ